MAKPSQALKGKITSEAAKVTAKLQGEGHTVHNADFNAGEDRFIYSVEFSDLPGITHVIDTPVFEPPGGSGGTVEDYAKSGGLEKQIRNMRLKSQRGLIGNG